MASGVFLCARHVDKRKHEKNLELTQDCLDFFWVSECMNV